MSPLNLGKSGSSVLYLIASLVFATGYAVWNETSSGNWGRRTGYGGPRPCIGRPRVTLPNRVGGAPLFDVFSRKPLYHYIGVPRMIYEKATRIVGELYGNILYR